MLYMLIGLIVILYLAVWYSMKSHWAKKRLVHETPYVFFGSLFDFVIGKRNIVQIHRDIYFKHVNEHVVGMHNFMKPSLLIRNPDLIIQILTKKFNNFSTADIEGNDDLGIGQLTFVLSEEQWRESKNIASPIFSSSRVKNFFEDLSKICDNFIDYLELHPEGEVKWSMSLFTCEIVASVGMGINGHSFDSPDPKMPKLSKMVFKDGLYTAINYSILFYIPFLAKILKARIVPMEVINFLINNVQEQINVRSQSGTKGNDVLQYYMDLQQSKTKDTINNSVDTLSAFFLESSETSSSLLSLVVLELANNRNLQQRCREEVDKLYEKGCPGYEEINDVPLLDHVLLELYRHHGQLMIDRKCSKTCSLDCGDGKSFVVEKGSSLVIPVLGLHMDPKYWGKNASSFDPSRWEHDFVPVKGTYLPFGAGPRICIGKRITDASIKIALVKILHNFYVLPTARTAKKFVQDPRHFLSMQKGGVYVKFEKRNMKF